MQRLHIWHPTLSIPHLGVLARALTRIREAQKHDAAWPGLLVCAVGIAAFWATSIIEI